MAEIFRREALEDIDSADNTEASGVSSTSIAAAVVVLVKIAAAVTVNNLSIPLTCEHLLFCEQQLVIAGVKLLHVLPFNIIICGVGKLSRAGKNYVKKMDG